MNDRPRITVTWMVDSDASPEKIHQEKNEFVIWHTSYNMPIEELQVESMEASARGDTITVGCWVVSLDTIEAFNFLESLSFPNSKWVIKAGDEEFTVSKSIDPNEIEKNRIEFIKNIRFGRNRGLQTTDSLTLLPKPFEWVEIPGKGYSIAKYPVTNAQFRLFLDANGYAEEKWWTKDGWSARQKDNLTEPLHWTDPIYNSDDQPVVGVSWFEAVAYCKWLSHKTDERIMLPTGDQWQYAAQGETKNVYPWGNVWDASRCNNGDTGPKKTTPVTRFEGKDKGDSPFGVTDMAGNVQEWCLTDRSNKTGGKEMEVRGGFWFDNKPISFQVSNQNWVAPDIKYDGIGFRLVLSLQS